MKLCNEIPQYEYTVMKSWGDEMSRYHEIIFHFLEYCILNIVYSKVAI